MKNRYEWNNPKEISNAKLYEVFKKSSLQNKLIIFRILSSIRRINLRKEWNKQLNKKLNKQQISNFLEKTAFILSPLKEWLTLDTITLKYNEIKNDYELMLIYQMMHLITINFLQIETVPDKEAEEISFNGAKQKMIKYLKIMEQREKGITAAVSEQSLIHQLEAINYKPPTKEMNIRLGKRDIFLKMMKAIGIGEDRAKRLIRALENHNNKINNFNNKDKQFYNEVLINFDSQIPIEYKAEAQTYFFNVFNYINQNT